MAETKVEIHGIEKLEVKTGIKDVPVEGGEKGETEKRLVTAVKFEYEGAGGQFDKIMLALAAEHEVQVIVYSPQGILDMAFEKTSERVKV